MPTPDLLDFETLLRPISDDAPTGINLREDISPDSLYYKVKDARAAARAAERASAQSEDPSSSSPPDWGTVLDLAPTIVAERSKDLEIVAWWIEALARTAGFAGLRDGFRLATGLVRAHWDGLFPEPDEDGIATRTAPLTGLNGEDSEGTLIVPIGMIPIVEDYDHPYGLWHYNLARELSRMGDESQRQAREEANGVSMALFEAAVSATSPDFFRTTLDDLDGCVEAFGELCSALDERCGAEAPPSSNIRNALEEVKTGLQYITKDVLVSLPSEPSEEPGGEAEPAAAGAAPAAPAAPPGAVRNRSEAITALRKIADFFRESEPHSPIPYLLDQAVRWGQTPLPELVKELIPDQAALGRFQLVTGLKKGSGGESANE